MTIFYPKPVDIFAWSTVCLSIALFLVALGGIVAVLTGRAPSEDSLHDTQYIVQFSRASFLPFLICLLLSLASAYFGYSMTRKSIEHRVTQSLAADSNAPGNPH